LRTASYYGHLEVVRELIAQGADANTVGQRGETALKYAQEKKHNDVVQLLIKAGAKQ
jgi:ankyrin repeat protein